MANPLYVEDYTGKNPDYRQPEKRVIFTTQAVSRIILPSLGAYYTNTLRIYDNYSNRPLVRGVDYLCRVLDEQAVTASGGQEVCRVVEVINTAVLGVRYSCQAVGGKHSSALDLIERVRALYPEGANKVVHWDDIFNRDVQFPHNPHIHSAKDTYGYDGVIAGIDRIKKSIDNGSGKGLDSFVKISENALVAIENAAQAAILKNSSDLQVAFEQLKVQFGEYIFTDSRENPAITRRYGNWTQVKNAMLQGSATSFVVGDGTVLALGSNQLLRNCYIWKNSPTGSVPTYKLTVTTKTVNPGDMVSFKLSTTGVAKNTTLGWIIERVEDGRDNDIALSYGSLVVDALGNAAVNVPLYANNNNEVNYIYRIRLENQLTAGDTFTLRAKNKRYVDMFITSDQEGLVPIDSLKEATLGYLQLRYTGYLTGDRVYLDASKSTFDLGEFTIAPPLTNTVSTSKKASIPIMVSNNGLKDGERLLLIFAKDSPDNDIDGTMPYAEVKIIDRPLTESVDNPAIIQGEVKFTQGTTEVFNINEGSSFIVTFTSTLPENCTIDFTYLSSKAIDQYSGLMQSGVTDANGRVSFSASNRLDYESASGAQGLTVIASYKGVEVARENLIIRDTSKDIDYQVYFSSDVNGNTPITTLDEGVYFYIIIAASNYTLTTAGPELNLDYGIGDNPATTLTNLRKRVDGPYYDAIPFATTAPTLADVKLTSTTPKKISIRMKTIAVKQLLGNFDFFVYVSQADRVVPKQIKASLRVNNTSLPKLTGTWSSSPTTLTPITQLNEMSSDGLNSVCYLFIDSDGDASSYGNIDLRQSGTVSNADLVLPYPQVIKFASGVNRLVTTVTIKADFFSEGNELLSVSGYIKDANNVEQRAFLASLTIVDNSVRYAMTGTLSTSSTVSTAGDIDGSATANLFSEWNPFYCHLTLPGFAFSTQVLWSIDGVSGSNPAAQISVTSGVLNFIAGKTSGVLPITPLRNRQVDGLKSFKLNLTLVRKADELQLSNVISKTFKLKDDSVPPSISLKFYTDDTRTTEITNGSAVNEGSRVFVRVIVTNPSEDSHLVFNCQDNATTTVNISGTNYTAIGASDSSALSFVGNMTSRMAFRALNSSMSYTFDTNFTLLNNRTTASLAQLFRVYATLVPGIIDSGRSSGAIDTSGLTAKAQLRVTDTSKTLSATCRYLVGSTASTSINEGVGFVFNAVLANAAVGDVFTVEVDNTFDTARLDISEFGVERIATTANASLNWALRVRDDRKTNGAATLTARLVNKTMGTVVAKISATINDTSKTPSFDVYLYDPSGNPIALTAGIPEGVGGYNLYVVEKDNLRTDEVINVTWVSGRERSGFAGNLFYPTQVSSTAVASKYPGKRGVVIPISVVADNLTNTTAMLRVTLNFTTSITNVTIARTLTILDNSTTLKFLEYYWAKQSAPASVISGCDEGDAIVLRVRAGGGGQYAYRPLRLVLVNNGGRASHLFTFQSYGAEYVRNTDGDWLEWKFNISNDYISNYAQDGKMSVRVYYAENPSINIALTLPIRDNANNANATITLRNADGSDMYGYPIAEGKPFYVDFLVKKPVIGAKYIIKLTSTHLLTNGSPLVYSATTIAAFSPDEEIPFSTPKFTFLSDASVASGQAFVRVEIISPLNNIAIAGHDRTIEDTSRPIGDLSKRIVFVKPNAQLSNQPAVDSKSGATINYILPTSTSDYITTAYEGDTIRAVMSVDDLALPLTTLNWSLTGTGAGDNWNGRVSNPSGSLTINQHVVVGGVRYWYVDIPFRNNGLSDPDAKTLGLKLALTYSSGAVTTMSSSRTVSCVERVIIPSIDSIQFSSNSTGSNLIAQTGEGTTIYVIVNTKDVTNGTALKVTSNDAVHAPGTFGTGITIQNNRAIIPVPIGVDQNTTGDKAMQFTVTLTLSPAVAKSENITLIDTSKTPVGSIDTQWYTMTAQGTPWKAINPKRSATDYADSIWCGDKYLIGVTIANAPVGDMVTITSDSGMITAQGVTVPAGGRVYIPVTMGWHSGDFVDVNYSVMWGSKEIARGTIALFYKSKGTTIGRLDGSSFSKINRVTTIDQTFIMLHPGEYVEIEMCGGAGGGGGGLYYMTWGSDGATVIVHINGQDPLAKAGGGTGGTHMSDVTAHPGYGGVAECVTNNNYYSYGSYLTITNTLIKMKNGGTANGVNGGQNGVVGYQYSNIGGQGEPSVVAGYNIGYGGGSGANVHLRVDYKLGSAAAGFNLGPIMLVFRNPNANTAVTSAGVYGGASGWTNINGFGQADGFGMDGALFVRAVGTA